MDMEVLFTKIMKRTSPAFLLQLLLIITCSASCEVHGEYLIKLAEVRAIEQSILQILIN